MKYLVLGAGMMGRAAAFDLAHSDNVDKVMVTDIDENAAKSVAEFVGGDKIEFQSLDVSNNDEVKALMKDCDAAISCVTYRFNYDLARAAVETKTHFCDLGGNNDVVDKEFTLNEDAKAAGVTILPDCGLAPGLVSILAADALTYFDTTDTIQLRVGGLPQNPKGPLQYMIVFSPTGLINEYKEDAIIIKDGKVETVPSMQDIETINLSEPYVDMEAFNTSGGISTLPKTMIGKVKNLDYKTIRFKGHCEKIKMMLDLGLASEEEVEIKGNQLRPRDVFEHVLAKNLSYDDKDVILLKVIAKGTKDNGEKTLTYECIDKHDDKTNLTAMMRMTAFPASVALQMAVNGDIKEHGVQSLELCIPTKKYLEELGQRNIKFDIKLS